MPTAYPLQRHKLGFMLKTIGPSELAFNIMKRSLDLPNLDVNLFWCGPTRPCVTNLNTTMHYAECYGYDGPVIATCLETAHKLLKMPTPLPKIFFVEDLEWMRLPNKQHGMLYSIYANPEFKFIFARTESHKKLIENAWNIKVHSLIEAYNFFTPDLINLYITESKPIYCGRQKLEIKPTEYNFI